MQSPKEAGFSEAARDRPGCSLPQKRYEGMEGEEEMDMMDQKTKEEEIPVRRIDRELKYQGTILKVYQDTVQVNGHEAKWDYIHHNGAAAVVAVTEEGKLLMVRQYRNALDRYTLEIPAGALDYPEEPKIDCAYRELEEETGFRTDHLEYLLSINTTIAFCDEAIDVFVARNLIPSRQHLDPDENIQVEEWELEDLLELIAAGKMTDGKTVASILAYAVKYRGRGPERK